jgi:hypothetical protein
VLKSILLIISCLMIGLTPVLAEELDEDKEVHDDYKYSETGLVERPDDMDIDEYYTFPLFGKPLYLGGEFQFAAEFMGNYELDPNAKDDLLEIEPSIVLECFYPFTEQASIYLEGELQYKNEYYTETSDSYHEWVFERIESWIYFSDIMESSFSFQAGRQTYEDERQWWWDVQLDSLRLHYDKINFHSEIAIAQELAPESTEYDDIEPEIEDVLRVLGHSAWAGDECLRLDVFGLYQYDDSSQPKEGEIIKPNWEDESDADLLWYGARVSGEFDTDSTGELEYWIDAAGLTGDETLFEFEENDEGDIEVAEIFERDVSGWGFDTGITWKTGLLNDMEMTLGYALGSGDRTPEEGNDKSFRQTGINEGDRRFQYYGEVFNPELSNMHIWTFAFGFPIGETSFIDFVYHQYRQVHPAPFLRKTDIEADPDGIHKSLGEEWDLVLNVEEWDNIEIESSASFFRAGDAFGEFSGEIAYRLNFEIAYKF